eukprot:1946176-Alexandrium_andersonii.AAC.1
MLSCDHQISAEKAGVLYEMMSADDVTAYRRPDPTGAGGPDVPLDEDTELTTAVNTIVEFAGAPETTAEPNG